MIAVSSLLLYIFVLIINKGSCVRIFENVLPMPLPTKYIPFQAKVISKTCLLKPERGPCRGGIKMYYFDGATSECKTFSWGGCQGNGNRFDTSEECENKCLSKEGAPKQRPKYCSLTYDYGYCFGALERWYYDNIWKTCKKTIYSGCGGNDNNFIYREQCESICLFRKGPIKKKVTTEGGPKKVIIVNPGPKTQQPIYLSELSKSSVTPDLT